MTSWVLDRACTRLYRIRSEDGTSDYQPRGVRDARSLHHGGRLRSSAVVPSWVRDDAVEHQHSLRRAPRASITSVPWPAGRPSLQPPSVS